MSGISQRRVVQDDVVPKQIKQRHLEALVIFEGLAVDRPDGSTPTQAYFATDTGELSLWDGTAWVTFTTSFDWGPQVIYSGDAVDRPVSGGDINYYWATDTTTFSLWDGSTWQDIVLPISGGGSDPWVLVSQTLTFDSDDDPTFVATTSADLTGTISVGMKLKLTQTTVRYFIVTAIDASTITLYGGTDYVLDNAAITNVYWSAARVPLDFPMDPNLWTEKSLIVGFTVKSIPVDSTWYFGDEGSHISLDIPIGCWYVSYQTPVLAVVEEDCWIFMSSTLATMQDAETDSTWTVNTRALNAVFANLNPIGVTHSTHQVVDLAVKTSYYLNYLMFSGNTNDTLSTGDDGDTVFISAICAYL